MMSRVPCFVVVVVVVVSNLRLFSENTWKTSSNGNYRANPRGRRVLQIRTQGSYVRKCLSTRDGGQCAECGVDAAVLYKRARAAWISGIALPAKREAVAGEMIGTPYEGKVRQTKHLPEAKFMYKESKCGTKRTWVLLV